MFQSKETKRMFRRVLVAGAAAMLFASGLSAQTEMYGANVTADVARKVAAAAIA
jgi:hypothetical protein